MRNTVTFCNSVIHTKCGHENGILEVVIQKFDVDSFGTFPVAVAFHFNGIVKGVL